MRLAVRLIATRFDPGNLTFVEMEALSDRYGRFRGDRRGEMGARGIRIALWCEETDYARFKCMNDGEALPTRYEQWAALARQELNDLLGCRYAAQIVRVKPDEYFAWLGERAAADTPLERKRYMQYLVAEAGGELTENRQ